MALGQVEDYSWYRLATSEVEHWGRLHAHSIRHFASLGEPRELLGDPFMCVHVVLRVVCDANALR